MDTPSVKNATICTNDPMSSPLNAVFDDTCLGFSTPERVINAHIGTQPGSNNIEAPILITPDHWIKTSSTSPGTLSKILAEGDLVHRMIRFEDSPNINIKPWDDEYSESPIIKRSIENPKMATCPLFNLCHRNPPKDIVDSFFDNVLLCRQSDLNRHVFIGSLHKSVFNFCYLVLSITEKPLFLYYFEGHGWLTPIQGILR